MTAPVVSLSLQRSTSGTPVISDRTRGALKVIGTGPLGNVKGERVGGVSPALKVYSVYSDRNVISWSWAQSSSLLARHLESPCQQVRGPSESQSPMC